MTTALLYVFPTKSHRPGQRLDQAHLGQVSPCDWHAARLTEAWDRHSADPRKRSSLVLAAYIIRSMREERARNAARIARETGADQLRLAI